ALWLRRGGRVQKPDPEADGGIEDLRQNVRTPVLLEDQPCVFSRALRHGGSLRQHESPLVAVVAAHAHNIGQLHAVEPEDVLTGRQSRAPGLESKGYVRSNRLRIGGARG